MPMVSESSSSPNRIFTVARSGSASSAFSLPNGRQRSQLGFRSGELSPEEVASLTGKSLSGNMVSLIKTYEDLDYDVSPPAYAEHGSRAWPVHDRDYTESKFQPKGFNLSYESITYPNVRSRISVQGALGFSKLNTGFMPSMASDAALSSMAASMLRNSRPPKAGFNLARFALEQREAPLLFKAANYAPRSKKELGGAYLNWMFGLKPTGSDLGKLAELVLRSDSGIRRLLDVEKVREKKYATKVLFQDSGTDTIDLPTSDQTSFGGTVTMGKATLKYVYLANFTTAGNYGNVLFPILQGSYTRKQMLRIFGTWEYFVPQPLEIHGRLANYRKSAELLLSSTKLDESTVWELTPWTWMSDWFVDFGGLLRYQRDVADNQIVSSGCGYSTWEEYAGLAHHIGYRPSPNIGLYPYSGAENVNLSAGVVSIQWRRHKRRGGNPYSISPTWSLTNQQWAITGALGLARGIGLPIKR